MFSQAIRTSHLLHRRDKEDAPPSPSPAAAPFHSPSPGGFAVHERPATGTPAPWTSSSILSRSQEKALTIWNLYLERLRLLLWQQQNVMKGTKRCGRFAMISVIQLPYAMLCFNLWMHVLEPIIDVSNVAVDYIRRKYPRK